MYEADISIRDIGIHLKISKSTVFDICKLWKDEKRIIMKNEDNRK